MSAAEPQNEDKAPTNDRAGFPISGLVRRARRIADLSQRELAAAAGVAPSTVGKIEAGRLVPSFALFQRLVAVAGLHLVAVDATGRIVQPMGDWADVRDGADRRYPSHLDTIVDPEPGEWWADKYGLMRPPETFRRDRAMRDWQRRRSQWEVRVAKYRSMPPPPEPRTRRWPLQS
jgi:transcriptional regulator with XRE-family HTH domain